MIFMLVFYLLVGLWGFYYLTIFIHLMGITLFNRKDIRLGRALIPFYYWFARNPEV